MNIRNLKFVYFNKYYGTVIKSRMEVPIQMRTCYRKIATSTDNNQTKKCLDSFKMNSKH